MQTITSCELNEPLDPHFETLRWNLKSKEAEIKSGKHGILHKKITRKGKVVLVRERNSSKIINIVFNDKRFPNSSTEYKIFKVDIWRAAIVQYIHIEGEKYLNFVQIREITCK